VTNAGYNLNDKLIFEKLLMTLAIVETNKILESLLIKQKKKNESQSSTKQTTPQFYVQPN